MPLASKNLHHFADDRLYSYKNNLCDKDGADCFNFLKGFLLLYVMNYSGTHDHIFCVINRYYPVRSPTFCDFLKLMLNVTLLQNIEILQ